MACKTLMGYFIWVVMAVCYHHGTTSAKPMNLSKHMIFDNFPLNGLATEHQTQAPILERVSPDRNNRNADVSRIYADGAYYMLSFSPDTPSEWFKLTELSAQGLALLIPILDNELISFLDKTPQLAPGQGKIIWRVHTECAYYEVTTPAGVYASLPPVIQKIDHTVTEYLLSRP